MSDRFLAGITDISFALYPSSWGRLQCNAKTHNGKQYHSWAGRPEQELTLDMLLDAIKRIDEQIPPKEVLNE